MDILILDNFLKKNITIPLFNIGDILRVLDKKNIKKLKFQFFEGKCISIKGDKYNKNFTLRKVILDIIIEKTFFINSMIIYIIVKRKFKKKTKLLKI